MNHSFKHSLLALAKQNLRLICSLALILALSPALAETVLTETEEQAAEKRQQERRELLRELDRNTQIIKERSLDLEHALYKLELDAQMHPLSETRWFFAVQTKKNYVIQHLRVLLDDKPFIEQSYHTIEAAALHNQGADRVFHGNLPAGEHQVKAFVEGYFKEDGKILSYETAASFTLDKSRGLTHLLLALDDTKRTWEPALTLQVWQ